MKTLISAAIGTALLLAAAPAGAAINGGFEDAGATTAGAPAVVTGAGGAAYAANGWNLYNNSAGTSTGYEAASTDPFPPGGGAHMFYVDAAGDQDGLYQFPGVFSFLSADFYVVSGAVSLIAAYGYSSVSQVETTATGVWQHLTVNYNGPADEIALYAFHGAARFYVDNVVTGTYQTGAPASSVTTANVPEPAAWAMMILGFGMAGAVVRRRREGRAAA